MKKTLFFSFGLCFLCANHSFNLLAQEYKSFDLNKYYTPDIVRNGLSLSGSSNGKLDNQTDESQQGEFNANLNVQLYSYLSTRKLVRSISTTMNLSGNTDSEKTLSTGLNSKSSNFNSRFGFNTNYKLYNPQNKFISLGGALSSWYDSGSSNRTDTLEHSDTGNRKYIGANADLYVGAGIGRIENVTEARQALFLIDVFSKNNILSRDLTYNEIWNLAQEMSRIKNKRFLDSRLHLMSEISHVDSFLTANNLITKPDALYFTNLYDIWLYGDAFQRLSGQSIELRLNPDFDVRSFNSKYDNTIDGVYNYSSENNNFRANYSFSLLYQYEKVINQEWQKSANASININLINLNNEQTYSNNNINKMSTKEDIASLSGAYSSGYYPNTRTNIDANINQVLSSSFYNTRTRNGVIETNDQRSLISDTYLEVGTYYYFSPQLRLSASANISNHYFTNDITNSTLQQNRLIGNYSIGLSYSFF